MNFNLPKNTEVNRFVAKNKFFDRVAVSAKVRNEFKDIIRKITWRYKLSEQTINTTKTDNVEEIQIFEVELKDLFIPKQALKVIDRAIPYKILYILRYNDKFMYAITLKTEKETKFYFSQWNQELKFDFNAINLEILYQNMVKQFIEGIQTENRDFKTIIETDKAIKRLEREISALKNKIRNEKQFNKKVELNKILKQKEKELSDIRKAV